MIGKACFSFLFSLFSLFFLFETGEEIQLQGGKACLVRHGVVAVQAVGPGIDPELWTLHLRWMCALCGTLRGDGSSWRVFLEAKLGYGRVNNVWRSRAL
jgi:hypothetical protein